MPNVASYYVQYRYGSGVGANVFGAGYPRNSYLTLPGAEHKVMSIFDKENVWNHRESIWPREGRVFDKDEQAY